MLLSTGDGKFLDIILCGVHCTDFQILIFTEITICHISVTLVLRSGRCISEAPNRLLSKQYYLLDTLILLLVSIIKLSCCLVSVQVKYRSVPHLVRW